MKKLLIAIAVLASQIALADDLYTFDGSTTLGHAVNQAIDKAFLSNKMQYLGQGGSGKGESLLVEGLQGIAPMSREIKQEAVDALKAKGVTVKAHIPGLDGISMFVNAGNQIPALDLATIAAIYRCQITSWDDKRLPGSNLHGTITVYRRDFLSGTTDAFAEFTHMKKDDKDFGPCTHEVKTTDDIKAKTSTELNAIGYAGRSAEDIDHNLNRAVDIARDWQSKSSTERLAISPTDAAIRALLEETPSVPVYPMARRLFVYEVQGAREANALEKQLLLTIDNRCKMDDIMSENDFVTLTDSCQN